MCLTFFYINPEEEEEEDSRKFKLILIFNRDEQLSRPTSYASWSQGILAGRDMVPGKEGGTWLAMDKRGRIGLLTNIYTGVIGGSAVGRGFLVTDFLNSDSSSEEYLDTLSERPEEYNPFNLVLLEQKKGGRRRKYEARYYCRGDPKKSEEEVRPFNLSEPINGIGNHPISAPYIKTRIGKGKMKEIIEKFNDVSKKDELIEELFAMMRTPDRNFPDPQILKQGTGSQYLDLQPFLSSIFYYCQKFDYGTRSQTLILVDQNDHVHFEERSRSFDDGISEKWHKVVENFQIDNDSE